MAKNKFPKWLLIVLIIFSALMITWQMLVCGTICTNGDFGSYRTAWNILSHHYVPDYWRPPVYPLYIGPLYEIFGECYGSILAMLGQWIVWVVGCWATWHILQYFGVHRVLCIATILSFLAFSGCWCLNNMGQADSFAIGGMPLFVLLLIRYIQLKRTSYIWWSGILLLMFIYLKPQFICLIPVVSIAWIYVSYRYRKHLMIASLIPIITILSITFYNWCLRRYQQVTVPLSVVSSVNNYLSMRMAGLIHVDEIENAEAREKLRPFIDADPGTDMPDYYYYWGEIYVVNNFAELERIWRHAYALHTDEMNRFVLHRFGQTINSSMFLVQGTQRPYILDSDKLYYKVSNAKYEISPKPDMIVDSTLFKYRQASKGTLIYPLYGIMDMPFWVAWLSIFLFTASYIGVWIKRRKFPVVAFMISATLLGGYLTVFIGAPCDWGRLVTPFCMLLFSTMAILLDRVCRRWGIGSKYK